MYKYNSKKEKETEEVQKFICQIFALVPSAGKQPFLPFPDITNKGASACSGRNTG